MTVVGSPSAMPTTHALSEASGTGRHYNELAALLPSGWSLDVPLARVRSCGPLVVEVLLELKQRADGRVEAVYGPPAAELLTIKGMTTAFLLLALLASQTGGFASKDFLTQTLPHLRRGDTGAEEDDSEGDGSLARLDNVVSLLRKLLCPPQLLAFPGAGALRKRLVRFVRATPESGPGYQLAEFPLLWLDVEAMETYVTQARKLEAQGEDELEEWQAVYQIGMRGPFLGHEPYSEWTDWRRGRVRDLLWQSVSAQCRHAERWQEGKGGSEVAVRLLLEFWQAQVANEDAFRALVDLLGKQERFQLAEECYRQLCAALDREGRLPHPRSREAMEVLRAASLGRESRRTQPALAASFPGSLEAEQMVAHGEAQAAVVTGGKGVPPAERLVAETRHLIGRETWLRGVCQMVQAFPTKKLVILQGPIGVGKSSELTRLADAFQRSSSQVIWLPLPTDWHSGSEAALDLLLGAWLGVCGDASLAPETPRERLIAALLAHLKQQHRPSVVLLDNGECLLGENGTLAACWEAFLAQFVRSLHQATLLLATKEWPGWSGRDSIFVAETFVPPLSLEESVCLLQRLGLEELPVEQLQAVGVRMAGIPLLLEWTARLVADPLLLNEWSGFDETDGILHAYPTPERRARRLQRLLDDPSLLGAHLASRLTPLLHYIMETRLSPEARRVLERLAVASVPLGKVALQVLCPRPALLKELRDASLLAAYTNRVQLLPMVAETVHQQLTPEQRREAEDQVIQAYTHWGEQGIEDDQEKAAVAAELIIFDLNRQRLLPAAEYFLRTGWLLAQFGHTVRIARLAFEILENMSWQNSVEQECGGLILRSRLAPFLGQVYTTAMRAQAYRHIYDVFLQGLVQLQIPTELHLIHHLALAHRNAFQFHEAQALLDQTLIRHPDLEETHLHAFASLVTKRATLLSTWSTYAEEQKEFELARELGERTVALYRQCIALWKQFEGQNPPAKRSSSRYRLAEDLNDFGYHLRQHGRLNEALAAVEESLALKLAGYVKPGSLSIAYGEKAQILAALGRFREALHFDQLAVEQIQQEALATGNSYIQSEVWVYLAERGQLYLRLGKLKEAAILFEQASDNMREDRHSYRVLAEKGLAEIQQWRQASPREQLDWRWAARYRELVYYDALHWLTPAAFSSAERDEWMQLQAQEPDEQRQTRREELLVQSRDREILAALHEGREPRLSYPCIPIAEVISKIERLSALAEDISREEPNVIVRRLYLDVIKENHFLLRMIQATYDGDTQAFWENNRGMHAEPTSEEMERALLQVAQLIALGKQRSDLIEVSETVSQFLQQIHVPLPAIASPPSPATMQESSPDTAANSRFVSPQTVQRFFDAAMRDYGCDGWRTIIDATAAGPYVEPFTQCVIVSNKRISLERARQALSHEIECHVFRAASGTKSPLDLLGTGTAFYRTTEEGLATYHEQATAETQGRVEREFSDGSLLGTLSTGLVCGVLGSPLTFSQLYQFLEQFFILQRTITGLSKNVEKARVRAPNAARLRCLRTFQGVPDLTVVGVAYTSDAIYHRGLSLVTKAIKQDAQVVTRLMVGKVGLQQLDDLAELGITEPVSQPRWLSHDPTLDQYILSFENE